MINLDQLKLIDLVPPNLRGDPQVQAAASALNDQLLAVTNLIPQLAILHRIDELPEAWVDELAWQWHVDFYDPTLPLWQRRELVKTGLSIHKRRGTPAAVEELMTTIFGDGIVEEWFEYGGQPGYFRVITSNFSATTDQAQRFLWAVDSVKNARSWLDSVVIRLVEDTFGSPVHFGDKITLKQEGLS